VAGTELRLKSPEVPDDLVFGGISEGWVAHGRPTAVGVEHSKNTSFLSATFASSPSKLKLTEGHPRVTDVPALTGTERALVVLGLDGPAITLVVGPHEGLPWETFSIPPAF
jgi:hypothetical protein